MAEYNLSNVTRAELDTGVKDFQTSPDTPDAQVAGKITYFYYDEADKHLGYFNDIAEIQAALKVFSNRVAGLGYSSTIHQGILQNIQGIGGEGIIQIMENMLICSRVFGLGIVQQIRNERNTLINLKPLYPGDLAVGVDEFGMIDHFVQMNKHEPNKDPKKLKLKDVVFIMNNRIANNVKGTSIIKTLKKTIDAYVEALSDERKIRHREVMGILEVDTEDRGEIATAISEYQKAVNKKDVFVTIKGVSEFKDPPQSPRDRVNYMQFLINQFYQEIGTPKILSTSEGYTESGGKAGLIAFEPTEIAAKKELEDAFWNQAAIKFQLTRTPSILGNEQETQAKNTGQTSIQPNETEVRPTRTE